MTKYTIEFNTVRVDLEIEANHIMLEHGFFAIYKKDSDVIQYINKESVEVIRESNRK